MLARVKVCPYCGRENEAGAGVCRECGTGWPLTPATAFIEPVDLPVPERFQLEMGFEIVEGFSRPDWTAIKAFIKTQIPKEDWQEAWEEAARRWLHELAGDLGGGSQVSQSVSFLCLSDLEPGEAQQVLARAELARDFVQGCLKEAAWTGYLGRHVLLLFADPEDYFTYISYFYPEGTHALTAGVFIRRGYAHIALPCTDISRVQRTLTHELVHNLLSHLPLPAWLNEGLAQMIDRPAQQSQFLLDVDMVDRHRGFWNAANIQTFWAGKSFGIPGESTQLSYDLGEILTNLLAEKGPDFIDFIKHADWRDAGQDAAVSILNVDLGEVLGGFLGPGNWRPQRKAIAECLKRETG